MNPAASAFTWDALPAWLAALNLGSAILLACGYYFIRHRRIHAHRRCMLSAFTLSLIFLALYLLHHWHAGVVHYTGAHRAAYLWLLGTHTVLAAAVPFLALITLSLALSRRFQRHRHWARWTLPIWFYVSVTGVAVYWVLYR